MKGLSADEGGVIKEAAMGASAASAGTRVQSAKPRVSAVLDGGLPYCLLSTEAFNLEGANSAVQCGRDGEAVVNHKSP